ncbi:RNA-dependent RNA polymerase [Chrysanthemum stem necrosis virus]|uniref:RNA-directed RNA polymerase L n=1 Tax=Chrysanthemum stem necrosis virus TaxID=83871 RepID=A0A0A7DYN2_9VIRU|nr:RNA-dependent RNA polymerase [Chrysanthemum stem necrosis virus]AIY55500.1 RNA-dependent RNA polymerase [Chrysanthemum stem necrosis virus]
MNTQKIRKLIENGTTLLLSIDDCVGANHDLSMDLHKRNSDEIPEDVIINNNAKNYETMRELIVKITADGEGLNTGIATVDIKKLNELVSLFEQKYLETELSRHDIFGELISRHLRIKPKHRNEVEIELALREYLEELNKKSCINNLSDNDYERVSKEYVATNATPDNYVIYKESKDSELCLIIYDWKISVDAKTETKTMEKYYKNIWKSFKDIKVNGKPFLEDHPVFISIVILKPIGGMPVTVTSSRVLGKFEDSPSALYGERVKHARNSKLLSINNVGQIAGTTPNIIRSYYASTQKIKSEVRGILGDDFGSKDVFFSHWTNKYRDRDPTETVYSEDIERIVDSLVTTEISREEIIHFLFGNFCFHIETMNDQHIADKFKGYQNSCINLKIKPKEDLADLKDHLIQTKEIWESLYGKHLDKIISRIRDKKKKEKEIPDITTAFNQNAIEYEEKYPGCFTNDLSETKTNFSMTWSPSFEKIELDSDIDYNNAIIKKFRESFKTASRISYNSPYSSVNSQNNKARDITNLVQLCLTELSCDTTKMSKQELEDEIDINTGSIKVERTKKSQEWQKINSCLTRNKNEFCMKETERQNKTIYFKGLACMNIGMSLKKRVLKKEEMKERISKGLEYDTSERQVDPNDDYSSVDMSSLTHMKKLIRHDNEESLTWCDRIKESLFVLHNGDIRNDGKISAVYNNYAKNPECLYTQESVLKSELDTCKKINKLCNDLSIYHYSEDMMQFAKGLMVADRYMTKESFKILTTANTSMLLIAFKGDGMNTGGSGVPYIAVHIVDEAMSEQFNICYTKEIYSYFKSGSNYIYIMRPQRLNQVRLLSLFKSPSKVPVCFSQFSKKASELEKWLKNKDIDQVTALSMTMTVKQILINIVFSSIMIGTVTKLSRMGIFDFMRYAGFLPLSDYSNIKEYIRDKFDPDITNVADIYFVNGIKKLLFRMEDLNLSTNAKPVVVDHENDIIGGITNLNIKCPITGSTLLTLEDLYNNVYLAIYMMPKSLHNHVHNLTSLLNVPAEWELKFRKELGFTIFEEIYPKKEMFDDRDLFSINGALNVKALSDYYLENITNVGLMRSEIENKEDFLGPCYRISTLKSSKKCSQSNIISTDEIIDCLQNIKISEIEDWKGNTLAIIKGLIRTYNEEKNRLMEFLEDNCVNSLYLMEKLKEIVNSGSVTVGKSMTSKFIRNNHPLTVETYLKTKLYYRSNVTILKSKKVSEELYDLVKQFHNIMELDMESVMNLGKGLEGKKHTFLQMLEFVMSKAKNVTGSVDFLVSVFEKMQRTKMDREIYLMSMKVKMMLYFIEHTFKHVAQSDPSEAISISGDNKIRALSTLSLDTITSYNDILNKNSKKSRLAFLSADQSKWSASDLTYKYVLAIILNPVLTSGEASLMIECILMYIKLKKVCIPTDIFLNLRKSQDTFGLNETAIGLLTKGLTTNTYPVSMNWLQGNLNYLSSVYHSCAMKAYHRTLEYYKDCDFQTRWIVHSDDNATSLIANGEVDKMLADFSSLSLPEMLFRSIEAHFKSFCITLNPKKSYASSSEVEFISERIVNGAIIPLYCRHLANCCTESSHISYFDDLMSLSIHVTMLLRKGCPNEVIPFAYGAVQVQALSLYSMLPGEVNDSIRIFSKLGVSLKSNEIPTNMGGWLTSPIESLSILGPSSNDQIIYYNVIKEFLNKKSLDEVKNNVSTLGYLQKRFEELEEKSKKNTLEEKDKKMIFLINLFEKASVSEDSDVLTIGMKFQTMLTQIIKLPQFVNENALSKMSSYRDFSKIYPNLKKNEDLYKSTKNVRIDEDSILEEDELYDKISSSLEMESVHTIMIENPETILIAPLNDRDFLLSQLFMYTSPSKRNQLSNQSTEKLALDRVLRSKARTFIDIDSKTKLTYEENMEKKIKEMLDFEPGSYCSFKTCINLVIKDVNFSMLMPILDSAYPCESRKRDNYNFRWFQTEKWIPVVEGSPGLVVMHAVYGPNYIENLGLKNIPLTDDSINVLTSTFGTNLLMDDVKSFVAGRKSFETDIFKNSNDCQKLVKACNYMITAQNRLLAINTCFSRKSFPFYSKFNLGKGFVSNTLALLSTIYSKDESYHFVSTASYKLDKTIRTVINAQQDLNLEKILDTAVYISDKLQSLFPTISRDDIKIILQNVCLDSRPIWQSLEEKMKKINHSTGSGYTVSNVILSHNSELNTIQKQIVWLWNMELCSTKTLNFVIRYIRRSDVRYVKTEEQDESGNYVSGTLYKIGIMTRSCYVQLIASDQDVAVSLKTPFEILNERDFLFDTYRESIEKLLQKFMFDKINIIKSKQPQITFLEPGDACIRMTTDNKMIVKVNASPRQIRLENVKFVIKIKYENVNSDVWDIIESQKSLVLRLPETGECFSDMYKTVDSEAEAIKTIKSRLITSLTFIESFGSLSDQVLEISHEQVKDTMFDFLMNIRETCLEGLENCRSIEEYDEFLDDNGFNATVELFEDLLRTQDSFENEYSPLFSEIVDRAKQYTRDLQGFKEILLMLKYSLINDASGFKSYRATGVHAVDLIVKKHIEIGEFNLLGMIQLIKACETCHNNDSILNLASLRNVLSRTYATFGRKIILNHELDLQNDLMEKSYDFKTLVLPEIKITEFSKDILKENGFIISGENLKINKSDEEFEGLANFNVLRLDEEEMYEGLIKEMRIKRKKKGFLFPANTLLLSELIKFLIGGIKGTSFDIETLLRNSFRQDIYSGDRLGRLSSSVPALKVYSTVYMEYKNVNCPLNEIADSLEGYLKLTKSKPKEQLLDGRVKKALIQLREEPSRSKKLEVYKDIASFLSRHPLCLSERTLYGRYTYHDINEYIMQTREIILSKINELDEIVETDEDSFLLSYLRGEEDAFDEEEEVE